MPALLLDLDKTLINCEDHTDYCGAVEAVRKYLGALPEAPAYPEPGWGRCAKQAMEILVGLAGRPEWDRASSLIEDFEALGAEQAHPMPGLAEFLRATSGHPRAIVTLCGPRATNRLCERFDVQVQAMVPRQAQHRIKPAPDQVVAALHALGVAAADAVMIGDSAWDYGAAAAAGVRFVGLSNGREDPGFPKEVLVVRDLTHAIEALLHGDARG